MGGVLGGQRMRVGFVGRAMRVVLTVIAMLVSMLPAGADGVLKVPSGQLVLPYEALWEDHVNEGASGETWLILRFLTPDIAQAKGKISYGDAAPDIDFLCEQVGLPLADLTGGGVDQIIVTLMDQPILRGKRDPAVTQFMSAYRVEEGRCIWE